METVTMLFAAVATFIISTAGLYFAAHSLKSALDGDKWGWPQLPIFFGVYLGSAWLTVMCAQRL